MRSVRCAIYTRKSSEEGLEQDFNSLDAQYAACAAYIASQASEGWILTGKRYDDGGISGGTLERPGLKRLLADLAAGAIDIVVVYKVDRLTRSLLDFARLVEAFDKAGVSFVSVTQSFNTTTSMGRLTLNMLLSFAQFEREMTAERIRDKLAASKARGMWMGGTPPLGYRPDGRSLAIVEEHAEQVRLIFKRYLELGNVRRVQDELTRRDLHKPVRTTSAGRCFGGAPFRRGELYAMLANPVYIGRIRHRETAYDGLHEAIIDLPLWEAVQAKLAGNRRGERHVRATAHASLLAGKLFDGAGERMVACHAKKGARRYRYYVSHSLQHGGDAASSQGLRLPAAEIEALVCAKLAELFGEPVALIERIAEPGEAPNIDARLLSEAQRLAEMLRGDDWTGIAGLLATVVQRIDITADAISISLDAMRIAERLGTDVRRHPAPLQIEAPAQLKRSGLAVRLILPDGKTASPRVDDKLLKAIATARLWWEELLGNPELSVAGLAAAHGLTPSWITRTLRLAFLDPAIVEQMLAGEAPAHLTLDGLRAPESVPALWSAQRARHRIHVAR
jgi:site-specific DNA recombinase